MRTLRWLLVIPSGVVGFYIAFSAGILIYSATFLRCAHSYVTPAICHNPLFRFADRATIIIGAAIAAILVVILPTLTAPSHRHIVAPVAFVSGAAAAVSLSYGSNTWPELLSALLAGGAALVLIQRRLRASPSPAAKGGLG